jgi:hypothetical protein
MYISNNKGEITNGTHNDVNMRLINSEAAKPYARSPSPCKDERQQWLKLRDSEGLINDARS